MYGIIRQGDGKYYLSMVFGYTCTCPEDTKNRIYDQYYLVLNEEKTGLKKQYIFDRKDKYLDLSILIVDMSEDDWCTDALGNGCVSFLWGIDQENIETHIPKSLLLKCIDMDKEYVFEEYPEIKGPKDIENLMCAAGRFHDAHIDHCSETKDGGLYVLFLGTWGCKVELWFEGDVSYNIPAISPTNIYPYWFTSSMWREDSFICFSDEENITSADFNDENYWFKAKRMRYHIIPV